ncbi:MAG: hypothetical protein ACTSWQ_00785 [Candidatus Thorarchaeota archaeon]
MAEEFDHTKCAGYLLADTKITEFKNHSEYRDEQSVKGIAMLNDRLDKMEHNNEEQHQLLNEKIDTIKTELTEKFDDMEINIGNKIENAFTQKAGATALKAIKWAVGVFIAGLGIIFREEAVNLFRNLFP